MKPRQPPRVPDDIFLALRHECALRRAIHQTRQQLRRWRVRFGKTNGDKNL